MLQNDFHNTVNNEEENADVLPDLSVFLVFAFLFYRQFGFYDEPTRCL